MDYLRRTWAEVSLDAIKHNFNEIKNKINGRAKLLSRQTATVTVRRSLQGFMNSWAQTFLPYQILTRALR